MQPQPHAPPDGPAVLPPPLRDAAVWMDTLTQATDAAMDTNNMAAPLTHLPGSSVFTASLTASPLRSGPSSGPRTPIQSSAHSPIFTTAKAKRVSGGTTSSMTSSSSAHTSPPQAAPTSASSADSGPAPRPEDRPPSRARKSQSRASVKKSRSKKPKRNEVEDAVADSDLYTVLQLDRSTNILCFLVTEQQRKERLAEAEAAATPANKHKFAYVRSKQPMHGYVCVREVEAKMLRNLPQYRSRDSQSFRSSIRQAFEKLHYWPLEATRPEVLVLKENNFLKMNAPNTCVYPISHIVNFLAYEDDASGNLDRWSKGLERRWAAWMETNGYELSDSGAENISDTVSDAGSSPTLIKAKPKPRARKQAIPRRAARVHHDDDEDDEEHEETDADESMVKGHSNPRGSPSSLAARRNLQPPPLQQHSTPAIVVEAARMNYQCQHQGFGAPSHVEPARFNSQDSSHYGHHLQPTHQHQFASHAHHEHGFQSHAPHAHAPLDASLSGHRRRGSSAQDMRSRMESMSDHHRPTPASSRAFQFVPSSHQLSHAPAPFSFQPSTAAAAAASGYATGGSSDPYGHSQGQHQHPLRPLIPVVQIRQPITLVLSPTSLACASDLRHSPDMMSPVSPPPPHASVPLFKGQTSPSNFLLKSPLMDALQQPAPLVATSQHHLQVPNQLRTGSELPAGFSTVYEPWSGRSAAEGHFPAALGSPSLSSAFASPGLTGSHPMHTVTTTTTTTTYAHQPQHQPMHVQSPHTHGQQHHQQQQHQQQQHLQPHQHPHPQRLHPFPPPALSSGVPPHPQDLSPMPALPPSMRAPPAATSFGAAVVQMAESIPTPSALNQRRRSLSVPAMLVEMASMRAAQEGEDMHTQNN